MNYLTKENVQEVLRLTPLHRDCLEQYGPEEVVQAQFEFRIAIDPTRFKNAWDALVHAREELRSVFRPSKNRIVHVILKNRPVELQVYDLQQNLSQAEQVAVIAADQRRPISPADGPLFRVALCRLTDGSALMLLTYHPVLMDNRSRSLILADLLALYAGDELLEKSGGAREYLTWFARQDWTPMQTFWAQHLSGFTGPTLLPVERRPASLPSNKRTTTEIALSAEQSRALSSLAGERGISPEIIPQAAWAILLSVYSGEDEVVFGAGTPCLPTAPSLTGNLIGPFWRPLPVRAHIEGRQRLSDLMLALQEQAAQRLPHAHLTLAEMLSHARPVHEGPLFESIVEVQVGKGASDDPLPVSLWERAVSTLRLYPVVIKVQIGERWHITCDYAEDLFVVDPMERAVRAFGTLLGYMAQHPDAMIAELPLLSMDEKNEIMVTFNQASPSGPLDRLVQQVIEARVADHPNAIAAVCGTAQITYGELNERANRMAHWLRAQGFGRDDLAAVFANRSLRMLVAILAVDKAGGAYVPLDPEQPDARLTLLLAGSQARVILTENEYLERSLGLAAAVDPSPGVLCLDAARAVPTVPDESVLALFPASNPPVVNQPSDLANVFYTSGSTGAPKGAMIEHVGMLNHLWSKINLLELDETSVVAQNASHCFDISVWQFLAPLMVGGRLVIYPNDVAMDPSALLGASQRDGVTVLEVVPTMLDMLLQTAAALQPEQRAMPTLRYLFSTGDVLPVSLCRRWLQQYSHVKVVNGYGATECSDDTTHEVIAEPPPAGQTYMSVGRPIFNFCIYVLDRWLRPVPVGCPGEIYFTGVGVGRGYLNDPRQTSVTFLPNPFADGMGGRMYRTGDMGRYLPDGRLLFLGRRDFQVKVRGYRIELGEIEAALLRHSAVAQSVVVVRKGAGGEGSLVGYVVLGEPVAHADLYAFLRTQLPEYMVPEHILVLEAFPVNSNGKVDRAKLPEPEQRQGHGGAYVAPRDRFEMAMVRLWEQVLQVQSIGVHDDFFALGGHSLKAVALISAVHGQLGVQLPLAALFKAPTVANLCALMGRAETLSDGLLNLLQDGDGSKPPLFLVHPGGGSILSYSALVSLLDRAERVYGIVPVGFDSDEAPLTSVTAMAELYVSQIQEAYPDGPYRIAGWSFGGIVAFEMVRRLETLGKPVEFLGILDTPVYEAVASAEDDDSIRTYLIRHFGRDLQLRESDLIGLEDEAVMARMFAAAQERGLLPSHASLETVRRIGKVSTAVRTAVNQYQAGAAIQSDIHLFRTTRVSQRAGSRLVDPDPWRELTAGRLHVTEVEGDHHTMVEPPHVHSLATAVQTALSASDRRIAHE